MEEGMAELAVCLSVYVRMYVSACRISQRAHTLTFSQLSGTTVWHWFGV